MQLGVRWRILLVALVVLLAAFTADRSHYFCKMMGQAVAECCCASGHGPKADAGATARAPDCCELITASKHSVVAPQATTPPEVGAATLVATLPTLEYPEPWFHLVPPVPSLARAPPSIGPPRFLAHCALLI